VARSEKVLATQNVNAKRVAVRSSAWLGELRGISKGLFQDTDQLSRAFRRERDRQHLIASDRRGDKLDSNSTLLVATRKGMNSQFDVGHAARPSHFTYGAFDLAAKHRGLEAAIFDDAVKKRAGYRREYREEDQTTSVSVHMYSFN
jgi:hypothetical protein